MEESSRCLCKGSEQNKKSQVWIGSICEVVIFILWKITIFTANNKKNYWENFETTHGDDESSLIENPIEEGSSSALNTEGSFIIPNHQRKKIKLHSADEHFANIIDKSLSQRNIVEKKKKMTKINYFVCHYSKKLKKYLKLCV